MIFILKFNIIFSLKLGTEMSIQLNADIINNNVQTKEVAIPNKFSVLPKDRIIPSWACKALLIALIIAAVAVTVFGIIFASAPTLVGISAAVIAATKLSTDIALCGAAISVLGACGVAAGVLCLHHNFEEDKKLAIRREMAPGKEEAIRVVAKTPDLFTTELFFEYVHPNTLSDEERKRLLKHFKNDSPNSWQRAVSAYLHGADEAKSFFDNMKDNLPHWITKCLNPSGLNGLYKDNQDRLSQYLKALWLKKQNPKEDKQILNLLYYSSLQRYPPASGAIFMHLKSKTNEKDIKIANWYLEKASYEDHSQALCLRAIREANIAGREKNNYTLNLRAAHQGSLDGVVNVIRCLRVGLGVKKDEKRAESIAKAFNIDPLRVKPYWQESPNGPQVYK